MTRRVRAVLDRRGRDDRRRVVAVFDGAERAIHAAQETGWVASGIGLVIRAAVHTRRDRARELLAGSPIGFMIAACAS
jgi:hypothetical protein